MILLMCRTGTDNWMSCRNWLCRSHGGSRSQFIRRKMRIPPYGCAADRNQAKIVFDVAVDMVRFCPALSKRVKILESQKKITYLPTNSSYQVLSADVANKHGFNTHGVIFDELHTQPNRKLFDVMLQGSGDARMQPLYFLITTAGNDTNSICYEVHQKAIDIAEGRKVDPTFYSVIYGAAEDEDWTDPKVWKKANPSLGITVGIDKVKAACESAQQNPGEENAFRQLRLNQWVKQSVRWMPMDKWDACAFPVSEDDLEGRICYGGLDLSSTTDITAFVLVFPPLDEEDKYYILPYFWIPEETLDLRVRRDHVPYDLWERQGTLMTTEGNVVHYGYIEKFIEQLGERFNIREIAFDRWGAVQMVQNLEGMGFTVAAAIAGIIAIIQNWGAITEWFGNLWNTICTGIGTMIESVKTWFSNLWTHLQNVWNGICNVVQTAVMLLGSIIQGAVDIITLPFRFIWENCKDIVVSVWDSIKNTVSSVLSAISGVISSIMGAIRNVISSIWDAISSKVSAVVNAIKNTVTSVFNAIKSVASSVWNGVKSVISTVVDGIKSKVSSVFNAVKSTVTSVFNGIKSTATTVWNGIKTAITKPIEAAKNTIKGIVDKISGFFSGMKLELPKIKLPHFKITGKLSLAPPSVPHLSIDWYKEGGIMTKPTIFGMNGSSLMAGGEAGREAVLPLKGFYQQLDQMISSYLNTSALEKYLAIIAENSSKGLYLDDGTLVGHLLPAIDSGLGKTQKLQRRLSL